MRYFNCEIQRCDLRCFAFQQPRAAWQSSFSTAGHVSSSVKSVESVVNLIPHIHGLVASGGLSPDGLRWKR